MHLTFASFNDDSVNGAKQRVTLSHPGSHALWLVGIWGFIPRRLLGNGFSVGLCDTLRALWRGCSFIKPSNTNTFPRKSFIGRI
jgi:hypothetical protein